MSTQNNVTNNNPDKIVDAQGTNGANDGTSYAANGIGSGAAAPMQDGSTMTYAQWFAAERARLDSSRNKQIAHIDSTNAKLLENIESQRAQGIKDTKVAEERGIVDANTSYAKNLAGYGRNAEQLAAMGLSGSGYSDYVDSRAYATQREEVQSVRSQSEAAQRDINYNADTAKNNAEMQAASDKLQVDLSYSSNLSALEKEGMQYFESKEEGKKKAYETLLSGANTGTYTSDQLKALGAQYGLSEGEIASLVSAADAYSSAEAEDRADAAYENVYNAVLGGASLDAVMNTSDWGKLTEGQKKVIEGIVNNKAGEKADEESKDNFDGVLGRVSAGELTQTEIDEFIAYEAMTDEEKASKPINNIDFEAWTKLTPAQKAEVMAKVKARAEALEASKTKEVNQIYTDCLGYLDDGYTYDQLKNAGLLEGMNEEQLEDLQNKADGIATQKTEDTYLGAISDIKSGVLTLDQIKNTSYYDKFTPEQIKDLEGIQKAVADAKSAAAEETVLARYATALGYIKEGTFTIEELEQMGMLKDLTKEQRTALAVAESNYTDTKRTADEEAKAAAQLETYNSLLTIAVSGGISADSMRALANRNGLGEIDVEALAAVAGERYKEDGAITPEARAQAQAAQAATDAFARGDDVNGYKYQFEAGIISEGQMQDAVFDYFDSALDGGMFDASDCAGAKGLMSSEQYGKICNKFNSSVDTTGNTFKTQSGGYLDAGQARALLENPMYSKETADALVNAYNSVYGVKYSTSRMSGSELKNLNTGPGWNFEYNGYELEFGDTVLHTARAAASGLEVGTFFAQGGRMYLKYSDDVIYEVRKRQTHNNKQFNSFMNSFDGDTSVGYGQYNNGAQSQNGVSGAGKPGGVNNTVSQVR